MSEAAADNDVLLKCACYALLEVLGDAVGGGQPIGILGAARYVIPHHVGRHPGIRDRQRALKEWGNFLQSAEELEPTADEVALATAIEEIATREGADLDGGESQLFAIAIRRAIPAVASGDKRAIRGLESIVNHHADLVRLAGRVVCLEQVICAMAHLVGADSIRTRVCDEPQVDTSLTVCFECTRRDVSNFTPTGLNSYIEDLRNAAPTFLNEGS